MIKGGSSVAIRIDPSRLCLFSSCVLVCSSWQKELWVGWNNGGARKGLVHEASATRTDVAMPLPVLLLLLVFEHCLHFSFLLFFLFVFSSCHGRMITCELVQHETLSSWTECANAHDSLSLLFLFFFTSVLGWNYGISGSRTDLVHVVGTMRRQGVGTMWQCHRVLRYSLNKRFPSLFTFIFCCSFHLSFCLQFMS